MKSISGVLFHQKLQDLNQKIVDKKPKTNYTMKSSKDVSARWNQIGCVYIPLPLKTWKGKHQQKPLLKLYHHIAAKIAFNQSCE